MGLWKIESASFEALFPLYFAESRQVMGYGDASETGRLIWTSHNSEHQSC